MGVCELDEKKGLGVTMDPWSPIYTFTAMCVQDRRSTWGRAVHVERALKSFPRRKDDGKRREVFQ